MIRSLLSSTAEKAGRPGTSVVTATTAGKLKFMQLAGQRDDSAGWNHSSCRLVLFASRHTILEVYLYSIEKQALFLMGGPRFRAARSKFGVRRSAGQKGGDVRCRIAQERIRAVG
jgi:hypothetical protein